MDKEMSEIRDLRTKIRSLEAELKKRLKGLRARANEDKANRTQIVKFINEIEGKIAVAVMRKICDVTVSWEFLQQKKKRVSFSLPLDRPSRDRISARGLPTVWSEGRQITL